MNSQSDARRSFPATLRNQGPILDVLHRVLPVDGTVLETGSGTGEHAIYFAPALAPRVFLTSEPDPALRESIAAWCKQSTATNLRMPIDLDVTANPWPIERAPLPQPPVSAILSINMIHIAPWSASLGLLAGAGRILQSGGVLYLYGPFKQAGVAFGSGNEAFDRSLHVENPEWGVRSLESVTQAAAVKGLVLQETLTMPAGNLSVIFEKQSERDEAGSALR
jgi:SAM-dependent methyltransferase